jgi:hypothetical protein
VELIVVLAIVGLMTALAGVALASLPVPRESAWRRELARARAAAIRTGRPVGVTHDAPRTTHLLFLPDGSARGPGVDPLTGLPYGSP